MGCRPSKHASSKIRAAEAMGGGFGAHFGSGKFSRRVRPGGFPTQVKNSTSLAACHPSTEFSDFSTTTATYNSPGYKTSKITVRLSSDGSTLEIEKCEIEPEVVIQRSESAPILPSTDASQEQTTTSFQQIVCADVAPVPYQFRSEKNEYNDNHSLLCSEFHTRIISSELRDNRTTPIRAPKATIDELDDFSITLPKATLAVQEETYLLSSATSYEKGSTKSHSSPGPFRHGKIDKSSSEKQDVQLRNTVDNTELLGKVGENRPDCIGRHLNCIVRTESAEVLCIGADCKSTSCSCNEVHFKDSVSPSAGASGISGRSHIESVQRKLAFCSYSHTTDESWDRGIFGLGNFIETHAHTKEHSRDGSEIDIYGDDLSSPIDKAGELPQISHQTYAVRASSLAIVEPGDSIKAKHNHTVSDKTRNPTHSCSSCQTQRWVPDITGANFYPHKRSGEGRNLIKSVTNEITLSVPCISHCPHGYKENVNMVTMENSVVEECTTEGFDETGNCVCTLEVPHTPRVTTSDCSLTCKEGIPVVMETELKAEEVEETDDVVSDCDIAYVHRDFINDFEDIFDDDCADAHPPEVAFSSPDK
ncbi:uncharacterized protein LOC124144884 isoform X1 [Haliotis rufescens]|uniref:uncharacterized protein LOC124144884 isoform X1 n=1 Tax=Haliotis rufescens TaxID=6454 RepID=UPI00201F2EB8|nr:uncharacterized protein LOC124144884 isoform X1 [Haliotis rufescens]